MFFDTFIEKDLISQKPKRLTEKEYRSFFANPNYKITWEQRLVKSVLEHCLKQHGAAGFDPETISKLQENMDFRRRYRFYLRVKPMIPISCVSPFTLAELNKMSIATILGSPSLLFTVSAFIGFGLPSFFFFHMPGYYAPDKLKPICMVGK